MKEVIYYYTLDGFCPYIEWFNELDNSTQIRINKRIKKLSEGLYGDHKPLQKSELSELRLDFGNGYRIYYYDIDNILILFIAGSEKKRSKGSYTKSK